MATDLDADRAAVLREIVDRALGEHAHKAVVTVDEYAETFDVSRSTAFEGVRLGQVPAVRIGRRLVVPVPALAAQLLGVHTGAARNGVDPGPEPGAIATRSTDQPTDQEGRSWRP